MLKSMLGATFIFLTSVFVSPGSFDEVYVGWGGINRNAPAHLTSVTLLQEANNWELGSKEEENPNYSVLSVRPAFSNYLDDLANPYRGIFHHKQPGGDDVLIAFTSANAYKQGATWSLLQGGTGLEDNPWEGQQISLPNITRSYFCNGKNPNKKYVSSQNALWDMQDTDKMEAFLGNITYTYNSSTATADAIAIASLEAGMYIGASTNTIDEWVEIASLETSTIKFTTLYKGVSENTTSNLRSIDALKSRHMLGYEGHVVLGNIVPEDSSTTVSNLTGTLEVQLDGAFAYAQEITMTSDNFSAFTIRMRRGSGVVGNFIIRLKSSLTASSYVFSSSYPVSNLATSHQDIIFSSGRISVTNGVKYYLTIEKENASTSPIYLAVNENAYAGGVLYSTYNSNGFNSNWNTGMTTLEYIPGTGVVEADDIDTILHSLSPDTSVWGSAAVIPVGSRESVAGVDVHKLCIKGDISSKYIIKDNPNLTNVKVSFWAQAGIVQVVTVEADKILVSNNFIQATWNSRLTGVPWNTAGCSGAETDYSTAGATSKAIVSGGWTTFEVSTQALNWNSSNNYGLLFRPIATSSSTSEPGFTVYHEIGVNSSNNPTESLRPKWILTTNTGSTESSYDLYFSVRSEQKNSNTVIYSRRNYPEDFPLLNTFNVPGRIVGLAKSGGYLIVASKDPDALHFYTYTGNTDPGMGLDFVTSVPGITFGSAKSVAYHPNGQGFFFFSGLGVYFQSGLTTSLVSGNIKDEAKKFSNYRDPEDYYAGFADLMPQGVIVPHKDTYRLAVPKDQDKNTYIENYNYSQDVWLQDTGENPTAMLTRYSGGSAPTLYIGNQDGQMKTLGTSGSTRTIPRLVWTFSKGDLHKQKMLDSITLWGRVDNPLQSCLVTLEVTGTDAVGGTIPTTTRTVNLAENSTTDDMQEVRFDRLNLTGNEFKFTLTQYSTAGAISLRSIRYRGKVLDTN